MTRGRERIGEGLRAAILQVERASASGERARSRPHGAVQVADVAQAGEIAVADVPDGCLHRPRGSDPDVARLGLRGVQVDDGRHTLALEGDGDRRRRVEAVGGRERERGGVGASNRRRIRVGSRLRHPGRQVVLSVGAGGSVGKGLGRGRCERADGTRKAAAEAASREALVDRRVRDRELSRRDHPHQGVSVVAELQETPVAGTCRERWIAVATRAILRSQAREGVAEGRKREETRGGDQRKGSTAGRTHEHELSPQDVTPAWEKRSALPATLAQPTGRGTAAISI